MSKIICDICGTTYQDTADCCPICGCAREIATRLAKEDFVVDAPASRPVSKKREIFDFDEANTPSRPVRKKDVGYAYGVAEDPRQDNEPKHNTFLVVVLTVLIVALLTLTGFLFVKFLMPNLGGEEPVPTTEPPVVETTQAVTTEPRIPCQSLALSTGNAELTHEGNSFLLNVIVTPEDTTDELTFLSADESVATVTTDGRITAVAEGETVITILCGDQRISCPVTCKFTEDTQPTEQTGEAAEPTAATTAVEIDPNVVLKLKKSDIRLAVYYEFKLELDCKLEPTQVTWSSAHPYIATVDENGVVTAVKAGTTEIKAQYGDQEVTCIVRCF